MGKRSEQTPHQKKKKNVVQMANTLRKRCSISYVISELQIKTNYDYRPTLVKIQNIDSAKCCQRNFYSLLVEKQKMVQPLLKTIWQVFCFVLFCFIKLNILSPYDLAIVLLSIYPNELKIYVHTKRCT